MCGDEGFQIAGAFPTAGLGESQLTCQIHVVPGVKPLEKELVSGFILDHLLVACQKHFLKIQNR